MHSETLRRFLVLLLFGLLAGCATTPAGTTAPVDLSPRDGHAALVIVRPFHLNYGVRSLDVTVDNIAVAELPNISFTVVYIKPGPHRIAGEGGSWSWPRREILVELSAGEVRYVVWRADEQLNPALIGKAKMLDAIRWDAISGQVGYDLIKEMRYVAAANAL